MSPTPKAQRRSPTPSLQPLESQPLENIALTLLAVPTDAQREHYAQQLAQRSGKSAASLQRLLARAGTTLLFRSQDQAQAFAHACHDLGLAVVLAPHITTPRPSSRQQRYPQPHTRSRSPRRQRRWLLLLAGLVLAAVALSYSLSSARLQLAPAINPELQATQQRLDLEPVLQHYIDNFLHIHNFHISHSDDLLGIRLPTLSAHISHSGDQAIRTLELALDFYNAHGHVIHRHYHPLVIAGDYLQTPQRLEPHSQLAFGFTIANVPASWQEGEAKLHIAYLALEH